MTLTNINQMKIHSKIPLPSEVMEHFGRILSIFQNSENKYFVIFQFIVPKIGYNSHHASFTYNLQLFNQFLLTETYMRRRSINYRSVLTIDHPKYFITFLYYDKLFYEY